MSRNLAKMAANLTKEAENTAKIYTLGLDIGSAASKAVVMLGGDSIVGSFTVPAGAGTSGPERVVNEVLSSAGILMDDITVSVATGYGRNSVKWAMTAISELTCHARGAVWLRPGVRTVIDIGGQDVKVLSLSEDGSLLGFVMNDKCAAGTGRFLEVMARILEYDVSELAALGEKAVRRVDITSTCTVFAESEVISQLASGTAIPELVAGIHLSVAVRAASLAKRHGVTAPVFMTSGVAKNAGVVSALAKELKTEINTDPRSQLAGAIGAALIAYEKADKQGGIDHD